MAGCQLHGSNSLRAWHTGCRGRARLLGALLHRGWELKRAVCGGVTPAHSSKHDTLSNLKSKRSGQSSLVQERGEVGGRGGRFLLLTEALSDPQRV